MRKIVQTVFPPHADIVNEIGKVDAEMACYQWNAKEVLSDYPELELGCILHPSPASPAANRGWAEQASQQLEELGIWKR